MNKYKIKANKSLGQNFLVSQQVVDNIVGSSEITKEDLVKMCIRDRIMTYTAFFELVKSSFIGIYKQSAYVKTYIDCNPIFPLFCFFVYC